MITKVTVEAKLKREQDYISKQNVNVMNPDNVKKNR